MIELTEALKEIYTPVSVDSAVHTVSVSDKILSINYTATGSVGIILPSLFATGQWGPVTIKDTGGGAGTNNITISTEGSEKIDGADTAIINSDYSAVVVYTDGTNYFIT